MHDPDVEPDADFDTFIAIELPDKPEPLITPVIPRPRLGRLVESLPFWPISRLAQAVFAEAFHQAIVESLPVDLSILLASEVNPSPRFKAALQRTATHVRAGETIEGGLAKTRTKVLAGLNAALRVGEEHGCLAGELATFAMRIGRLTPRRYHRAIGRATEAIDFAAALGRLLRNQRLTVRTVRAAGDVAAGGNTRFAKVAEDIAVAMEDGRTLAEALGRHPRYFDPLYRKFLETARSREEIRACLERLGKFH